jgi:hypothetical protein
MLSSDFPSASTPYLSSVTAARSNSSAAIPYPKLTRQANLPGEYFRGGMFGYGLDRNLQAAYRRQIENYSPGDDIFVLASVA